MSSVEEKNITFDEFKDKLTSIKNDLEIINDKIELVFSNDSDLKKYEPIAQKIINYSNRFHDEKFYKISTVVISNYGRRFLAIPKGLSVDIAKKEQIKELVKQGKIIKGDSGGEGQSSRNQLIDYVDFLINFYVCLVYENFLKTDTITHGPSNDVGLLDWYQTSYVKTSINSNMFNSLPLKVNVEQGKKIEGMVSSIEHNLETQRSKNEEKINSWETKISESESFIEKYSDEIKRMKGELGFLKLNNAFEGFIGEKSISKWLIFSALILIGFIIITLPLASVIFKNEISTYLKFPNLGKETGSVLFAYFLPSIPIVASEIILIFYFRIILQQYNFANAQLMQLKMRQSLCQFIESYSDFKGSIENKRNENGDTDTVQNNNEFEKFETLIFSNLMPSPEQVPSTFDGIEQISKLIKNVK